MKKKNVYVRTSASFFVIPYLNILYFLVSYGLLLLFQIYDPTIDSFGPAMIMAVTCLALIFSFPFTIMASILAGICFGIAALAKGNSIWKAIGIILLWVIVLLIVILTSMYILKSFFFSHT